MLALAVVVLLQFTMSEAHLQEWGWRVAFGVGALLAFAVYFSAHSAGRNEIVHRPGRRIARSRRCSTCGGEHPREFLIVAAISGGGSIAFYAYTTYMQKFLVNTSGFSRSTATEIMTVALVVFMLIQPLVGARRGSLGAQAVLYLFGFGGMLASFPVFTAISHARAPLTALG